MSWMNLSTDKFILRLATMLMMLCSLILFLGFRDYVTGQFILTLVIIMQLIEVQVK